MAEIFCKDEQSTSISWLDDWVKSIYYFENVVLRKAKQNHSFTDQEIVDMTGWAIALDNILRHSSIEANLKELIQCSTQPATHETVNVTLGNIDDIFLKCDKRCTSKETRCEKSYKPSTRMMQHLVNNIRLSNQCLGRFLKFSSEHIPSLNLTEVNIDTCLKQREEFKVIFKSSILHLTTDREDHSVQNCNVRMLTELFDIILEGTFGAPITDTTNKKGFIDSYEKALLNLAVLADKHKVKTISISGNRVQDPWQFTKHFVSLVLSSPNVTQKEQVNLLMWLDAKMFDSISQPALCDKSN